MRIDIHTHFIPPYFIDEIRRGQAIGKVTIQQQNSQDWVSHPEGYRYPLAAEFWDMAAKLQHMDNLGIDISVLSISPTMLFYWLEAGPTQKFCQRANEAMAEFVSKSAGRLYGMATVPLQEPKAATIELRRAVVELGLRGVEIGTTMEDIPLDNEQFESFWATAAELDVPVMLHPYYVGTKRQFADFYMTNLVGNPLETGVAASRLILSGCLDRHPKLKVVLVHAGGFMPYQIGRLDHGFRVRKETSAVIDSPPSSYLRRFYYDTITHAGVPLNFLVKLVGADRVVLGTDIPFDMADTRFAEYFTSVEANDQAMQAINGDNARHLFKIGEA